MGGGEKGFTGGVLRVTSKDKGMQCGRAHWVKSFKPYEMIRRQGVREKGTNKAGTQNTHQTRRFQAGLRHEDFVLRTSGHQNEHPGSRDGDSETQKSQDEATPPRTSL